MKGRGQRTGSWVALAAAYLLFVQALLTGASLGAQAAPVVDVHGSILCNASALDHPAPGSPADHGGAGATCCILGCAAAGTALPPTAATALPTPARHASAVAPAGSDAAAARPTLRTPRLTRAPPLA